MCTSGWPEAQPSLKKKGQSESQRAAGGRGSLQRSRASGVQSSRVKARRDEARRGEATDGGDVSEVNWELTD